MLPVIAPAVGVPVAGVPVVGELTRLVPKGFKVFGTVFGMAAKPSFGIVVCP